MRKHLIILLFLEISSCSLAFLPFVSKGVCGRYCDGDVITSFKHKASRKEDEMDLSSTYENSDASTKGVVSYLTNFVNFMMGGNSASNEPQVITGNGPPPKSPMELLEIIREDYVDRNYLWTGDIYTPAFEKNCRFTDPTLSFTGTDQFVSNVQNLRPILDALMEQNKNGDGFECKSDLLNISLNEQEGYVQSRWNMVGRLGRLPWTPKIDVIGRTKFWYQQVKDENGEIQEGVRVYFYDEEWEIPASKALLQLVSPDSSKY